MSDEDFEFDCLTVDQTDEILNEPVEILSSVLMLPLSFSKLLLSTNKWALDSVIENYLKDSSQFLILSKLKAENTVNSTELPTTLICPICSTMFPKEVFSGMDCNHLFCRDCWCTYFQNKVLDGTSCAGIECMSCSVIATEDFVLSFLVSPDLKDRYKRLTFTEYVNSHPELRFCPGPNCNMIIRAKDKKTTRVICHSCNTTFCFRCGSNYHAPADCDTIQKWFTEIIKWQSFKDDRKVSFGRKYNSVENITSRRKLSFGRSGDGIEESISTHLEDDDVETIDYIAIRTKACPRCKIPIEKNGGCKIMCCTRCSHIFCWICLDELKFHGCQCHSFMIPNRRVASTSQFQPQDHTTSGFLVTQLDSVETAAATNVRSNRLKIAGESSHAKFLRYFRRWEYHAQHLCVAEKERFLEQILISFNLKTNNNGTKMDWQNLLHAAALLERCHYTLQYTYAYDYFLESGIQKDFFEYQQALLEVNVQLLAAKVGKAENNITMTVCENLRKWLQDSIN